MTYTDIFWTLLHNADNGQSYRQCVMRNFNGPKKIIKITGDGLSHRYG